MEYQNLDEYYDAKKIQDYLISEWNLELEIHGVIQCWKDWSITIDCGVWCYPDHRAMDGFFHWYQHNGTNDIYELSLAELCGVI